MRKPSLLFVLVVFVLTFTTFAYWPARPARAADGAGKGSLAAGMACKIYFRGDAAGQSVQSYVASVANNASVGGTIVSIDDQWIVVAGEKKEIHVPRSVVLMVEVSKP